MVSKSRLKQIRNEHELYHMVYSQAFFGDELENLDAACNFHAVNYRVFCDYQEIASNYTFDEPSSYMLLITDSPTKLINLHLCTELSDAIYLPQSLRTDGLEKRLDVWLGLPAGRIEPNPSELPSSDTNSIINQFDQIEDQYKVVIFFPACVNTNFFLTRAGFGLKTSSHPHEFFFLQIKISMGGLFRPTWVHIGHVCGHV